MILALIVTLSGSLIVFSHLPTFTVTREIFLPLDEDWMHYFCCFLNHLDTILKCPLGWPILEMCKVSLAMVSRAVQWCAGDHGGPWGLIPLHSILMGSPRGMLWWLPMPAPRCCCLYGCRTAPHSPTVTPAVVRACESWVFGKKTEFWILYSIALFHMLFNSSEYFIQPSTFLCSDRSHTNKKSIGLLL